MSSDDIYWIIGLTLLFEGVTCFFRFGLRLQSTRDTGFIKRLTFGLRIHHGYLGLLAAGGALLVPPEYWLRAWLLRGGIALVVSDLIHHFLVLWPITGSPEFDLTYPR